MYMKTIIFITILVILLSVFKKNTVESFEEEVINKIWMYWENKPGKEKPEYLKLCYKTIEKNCGSNFELHLLDENTVKNFLPNMRDLSFLSIPQKADYIRLSLLKKYGGIWLDSDIIVIKNLQPIIDKLKQYDFVGFGCHYNNCKDIAKGYPKPANWVLVSRRNGKLISNCLKKADKILDNNPDDLKRDYHKMGRKLLWGQIDYLLKNDSKWSYYHYDSRCIERDSNGIKLRNNRSISNENLDEKCKDKYLFIPIYNTAPGFPKWFLNMSQKELLNGDMLISKLFRLSFDN